MWMERWLKEIYVKHSNTHVIVGGNTGSTMTLPWKEPMTVTPHSSHGPQISTPVTTPLSTLKPGYTASLPMRKDIREEIFT
jgi:hypothetical protein